MSKMLALPAVIVANSLELHTVPGVLAAGGGVHFLPYAWLHRTRIHVALAVAASLGPFALQLWLKSSAFPYILLYQSVVYSLVAPLVYRHAKQLTQER
jgi:hypothetical protein